MYDTDRIIIRNGVTMQPPPAGGCSCVWCCTVRHQHLWLRAVSLSIIPAVMLWAAIEAHRRFQHDLTPGSSQIVGGLLIVATLFAVLALCSWWSPLRRAWHAWHPRATGWPPPV